VGHGPDGTLVEGVGLRLGACASSATDFGGIAVIFLNFRDIEAGGKKEDRFSTGGIDGLPHVSGDPRHSREQTQVSSFQSQQLDGRT
jgi:hypothetical protein